MSEVLVGSAYVTMEMRYQQFAQGASVVEQQIQRLQALSKTPITVQAQISTGAGSGAGALTPPTARGGGAAPGVDTDAAAYTRLVRAEAALDAQNARLARSQGDTAKAAQLEANAQEKLTNELNAQNGTTVQSIAIERQLASVQQQSARGAQQEAAAQQQATQAAQQRATVTQEIIARAQQQGASALQPLKKASEEGTDQITQFGAAFKSGLLGVVGPAAAAGVAIGTLKGTIDSFSDALKFKGELDQTTASITAQLRGVRDSGQAFQEAAIFADRYKLTQEDTASAIQSSIPLLRQSKSSLTDVLTVLSQLQVLKPSEGIQGAAFALAELQGGQSRSLATRFNIPIAKANQLKDEIVKGGDAVKLLGDYLTKAGIGSEALEARTKGVAGALNDAAVAQERLKIAQGNIAASAGGIFITEGITRQYQGLANLLNGDAGEAIRSSGTELRDSSLGALAYATALAEGKTKLDAFAAAQEIVNNLQKDGRGSSSGGSFSVAADTAAIKLQATAYDEDRIAAGQAEVATRQKADADTIAGINAQTHAIAEKQIDDSARAAANAMLASGAAGVAAAEQLRTSISPINARTVAYYELERAALAARNAENNKNVTKALTTNRFTGRSGGREGGSDFAAETAASVAATKAQTAAQERQIDAQIALAQAHGNTAKQIQLLRQKEKLYGKDEVDRQNIKAQIIGLQKSAGKTRVDAAQATGLQLAQTEQNSQAAILKAQREGQERLRDSQQDYELNRSRKQEDYEEQRRKLLDSGQRKQADLLAQQFAKEQRRAAEDFNIARGRTLRNNAESTGDIDARTDLRQSQIGDRAALRGVRPAGGAPIDLGSAPPTLTGAGSRGASGPIIVRFQVPPVSVQIDGHQIVELTWPEIEQRVDIELSEQLIQLPPVGGGQSAVAGNRP